MESEGSRKRPRNPPDPITKQEAPNPEKKKFKFEMKRKLEVPSVAQNSGTVVIPDKKTSPHPKPKIESPPKSKREFLIDLFGDSPVAEQPNSEPVHGTDKNKTAEKMATALPASVVKTRIEIGRNPPTDTECNEMEVDVIPETPTKSSPDPDIIYATPTPEKSAEAKILEKTPPKLYKDEKVLELGKLFYDSFKNLDSPNQLNFPLIQMANPPKLRAELDSPTPAVAVTKDKDKVSPVKKPSSQQSQGSTHSSGKTNPESRSSNSNKTKSPSKPTKPGTPNRGSRSDGGKKSSDQVPPDSTQNKLKKSEMANLIVKCLMPFYKHKLIDTREKFKSVARDLSHKAIEKGLAGKNQPFSMFNQ
jgi:hypothetical protein